ncbi:MAG TPA: gluconate 2-dehydrogenase subunit 3 family protein [Longimicrobiales bacterium]|nr:gluconate 2-dehydrogenase subunit 3 family protein [Longimicrobiales bacterium]
MSDESGLGDVNVNVNVNVHGSSGVSRRQALGMIAAVPAAAAIPPTVLPPWIDRAARAARAAIEAGSFDPRFFKPHEWATVRMLVDLIIPRDERSGSATDAGVPEFMDFMLMERTSMQTWMREGLAWLGAESARRYGTSFVQLLPPQYGPLLDDIARPRTARPEMADGVEFFNRFRDLTATGFFSSRMGVQDLGYQGNAFTPVWNGCPPEARDHLEP